jgi:Holliday junction resolvase RusA-like endonuclease
MITFTIPAVPIAQPRQRMAIIAGRPRNYTPTAHPVNAFKALAKLAYAKRTSYGPADGPLTVSITFIMPRPKNKVWKQKPMPRYCHTKKTGPGQPGQGRAGRAQRPGLA